MSSILEALLAYYCQCRADFCSVFVKTIKNYEHKDGEVANA